ncbi:MAG: hypothetical protein ACJAZ3_000211 [Sphingobacteriales bacterium]|jgi:hypothetical protein
MSRTTIILIFIITNIIVLRAQSMSSVSGCGSTITVSPAYTDDPCSHKVTWDAMVRLKGRATSNNQIKCDAPVAKFPDQTLQGANVFTNEYDFSSKSGVIYGNFPSTDLDYDLGSSLPVIACAYKNNDCIVFNSAEGATQVPKGFDFKLKLNIIEDQCVPGKIILGVENEGCAYSHGDFYNYQYSIDWGDGTSSFFTAGTNSGSHTYSGSTIGDPKNIRVRIYFRYHQYDNTNLSAIEHNLLHEETYIPKNTTAGLYHSINYDAYASTTWRPGVGNNPWDDVDGIINIKDELRIMYGANIAIEDMTFKFGENAKVIVANGARLTLRRTKFTVYDNCPNIMWTGIQVAGFVSYSRPPRGDQYDCSGRLNVHDNSTIEHAFVAVLTARTSAVGLNAVNDNYLDYYTTGGVIFASNSNFLHNYRSVWIPPFVNVSTPSGYASCPAISGNEPTYPIIDYNSKFTNCKFLVVQATRRPILKTIDGVNYLMSMLDFVRLEGVEGVRFHGNTFENQYGFQTHPSLRGAGIHATDASLEIYPSYIDRDKSSGPNIFKSLSHAVRGENVGALRTVNINSNNFIDNRHSIVLWNGVYEAVYGNIIQVPGTDLPTSISSGIFTVNTGSMGLFNNDISGKDPAQCTNIGIYNNNSGTGGGDVFYNSLTRLNYSLWVDGANSNLHLWCNDMAEYQFAIRIPTGTLNDQGEGCLPRDLKAGNKFITPALPGSKGHIFKGSGVPNFNYFYRDVMLEEPMEYSNGVFTQYCGEPNGNDKTCTMEAPDRGDYFQQVLETDDKRQTQFSPNNNFTENIQIMKYLAMDSIHLAINKLKELGEDRHYRTLVSEYYSQGKCDSATRYLSLLVDSSDESNAYRSVMGLLLNKCDQNLSMEDFNSADWQLFKTKAQVNSFATALAVNLSTSQGFGEENELETVEELFAELEYNANELTHNPCRFYKTGDVSTDIIEDKEEDLIAIYPNPIQNSVTLSLTKLADYTSYEIVDLKGSVVITGKITQEKTVINTNELANSVYQFVIKKQDGSFIAKRLVKLN